MQRLPFIFAENEFQAKIKRMAMSEEILKNLNVTTFAEKEWSCSEPSFMAKLLFTTGNVTVFSFRQAKKLERKKIR